MTEHGSEVLAQFNYALSALQQQVFSAVGHEDIEATIRVCKAIEAAAAPIQRK